MVVGANVGATDGSAVTATDASALGTKGQGRSADRLCGSS